VIAIRTYLRLDDSAFRPVQDCVVAPPDVHYIEGAIELTIDRVEIMGVAEWDYVDQLWSYIATMVDTLRTEDRASTYFPDQPILLTFERSGRRVLVSRRNGDTARRAGADESEFIAAVRDAGRDFFERMAVLVPSNSHAYRTALAKLESGGHGPDSR
jgi:hypothetical protein